MDHYSRIFGKTTEQQCQKCLGTDHWTYECTKPTAYLYRPSVTIRSENPQVPIEIEEEDEPPSYNTGYGYTKRFQNSNRQREADDNFYRKYHGDTNKDREQKKKDMREARKHEREVQLAKEAQEAQELKEAQEAKQADIVKQAEEVKEPVKVEEAISIPQEMISEAKLTSEIEKDALEPAKLRIEHQDVKQEVVSEIAEVEPVVPSKKSGFLSQIKIHESLSEEESPAPIQKKPDSGLRTRFEDPGDAKSSTVSSLSSSESDKRRKKASKAHKKDKKRGRNSHDKKSKKNKHKRIRKDSKSSSDAEYRHKKQKKSYR